MMDIYLSGRFTTNYKIEKAWIKRTGCRNRCFSFAFVDPLKTVAGFYNKKCVDALRASEDAKVQIMMDSGAFSLHKLAIKRRPKNAPRFDLLAAQEKLFNSYVAYCLANKDKWAFYVTLDFKKDQQIIYDMQQAFAKKNLAPMPAYHGDSSLDWLLKHKDMGHNYICIGGLHLHKGPGGVDFYLDKLFNFGAKHGLEYHGLAMTSLRQITTWPFKSVDSSTWSRTAAFGMILLPDMRRRKFLNCHVSDRRSSNPHTHHDLSQSQRDKFASVLKDHGFDFKAMLTSENERHDWNGYVMSNLDKFGLESKPKKMWETLL